MSTMRQRKTEQYHRDVSQIIFYSATAHLLVEDKIMNIMTNKVCHCISRKYRILSDDNAAESVESGGQMRSA